MYQFVYFDVIGSCNARCPWCETKAKDGRIDLPLFRQATEYMLKEKLIGRGTRVGLFNWGEPFLHPQFKEIIEYMSTTGVQFGLSTNASIRRTFDNPTVLRNLQRINFSMCGFSQKSYDRIQQLSFKTARDNIAYLIDHYRDCGFRGDAYLLFHVYQFNIHEVAAAREFAERYCLKFTPLYAHFNSCLSAIEYLTDTMPQEMLKQAGQSMMLSHVPELIAGMPKGYECPQHNRLVIDERLNVKTCCVVPQHDPEYCLGHLFDMSYESIQAARMQPVCKSCLSTGAAYWIHTRFFAGRAK